MRKIISVLFAAVFVLCLPLTVFAANETEAKTELTFIYSPSSPTYTVEVDGTWKKGTDNGLTITTNGNISKFEGVKIDGVLIDPSNYTLSGNTIITLKPEFLETLSVGEHSIQIVFADGSVQTVFIILDEDPPKDPGKDPNTPPTGDNSNPALWLCLGGSALLCLGGTVIAGRKRKRYSEANK